MKTTAVSTQAIANATRISLLKLQAELARGSQELSSGRHADVGLALGARTGRSVELRQELARIETIIDTNGLVASRLDTTQAALSNIRGTAEEFMGVLIAVRDNALAPDVIAPQAALNLRSLVGSLNANLNGQYLFAGIDTDRPPVADFFADPPPPGGPRAAVDAAFLGHFGFPPNDPLAAGIAPAQMTAFLDGPFRALFEDPQWGAVWSTAAPQNVTSRISTAEVVETSANANERGFRDLVMAYAMLAGLGPEALPQDAYRAVVERAISLVGGAAPQVITIQARLGVVQNRVADASDRMAIQRDILTRQVAGLENVDPFETATRVNALMSQIEISYSLTARIREMSLIRYL